MAKEKKERIPKNQPKLKFLKSLEQEDVMHDDHGPVIIGRRDRKPNIPDDQKK